jgi:hypothetical protein
VTHAIDLVAADGIVLRDDVRGRRLLVVQP